MNSTQQRMARLQTEFAIKHHNITDVERLFYYRIKYYPHADVYDNLSHWSAATYYCMLADLTAEMIDGLTNT